MVRSHYKGGEATRERTYAVGNGLARWLGLGAWYDVVTMQNPESVVELRRLLKEAA